MVNYSLVLWCLIILLNSKCNGDENVTEDRPYFRIVAPQFICSNQKTNLTEEDGDKITIRLQTLDGQSFRFIVAINFTIIGGFKNQKHTLSIWKNVRKLQDKFNKIEHKNITLNNQIVIVSKELTPLVIYTFRIVGVDNKNATTDVQQFTVTYKGGTLKQVQSNVGEEIEVSMLLIGTETLYGDITYLSVAEAIFCVPTNDYFFKWEISNISTELSDGLKSITGETLLVPTGNLKAGNSYEVSLALFHKDLGNKELAKTKLNVQINNRDFILQIAPARSTIGINKQQVLTATFSNLKDKLSSVNITWECIKKDGPPCEDFVSNNSVNQIINFSNEGTFILTAKVQLDDLKKEAQCEVIVIAMIIPYVFLKSIPLQPINVKEDFQMDVTIVDLIPKCFVNWTVAEVEGFATIEESILGDAGSLYVKDMEETFLNELVDYQNNTVTMDVTLKIPALWENWEGLVAGEKYKFRLLITCPEAFEEENMKSSRNITNSFEFDFLTNAPPNPLPLVVDPPNGTAMETEFKLKAGAAKDLPQNFPLKYSFGYTLNNMTLRIATYYENTITQAFELPLSSEENPINSFYEVCDSNQACILFNGPTITTIKGNYTQEDVVFRLAKFKAQMERATYNLASNTAAVMLITLQEETSIYQEISKTIMSSLQDQLKILKSISSESLNSIQEQQIVEFIKMSRFITYNLSLTNDETFVSDLLSLVSFIDQRSTSRKKRTVSTQNKDKGLLDRDFLKTVLSYSEILLNSKNVTVAQDERLKIVKKIHKFVARLCKDSLKDGEVIETAIANFEVVKILPRQVYFGQFSIGKVSFHILGSSTMSIGSLNSGQYLCMAKINYLFDVMETKDVPTDYQSEVFEILLLQKNPDNSDYRFMDMSALAEGIVLNIKIDSESELQCSAWKGKSYSSSNCKNYGIGSNSSCNCKTHGDIIVKTKLGSKSLSTIQTGSSTTEFFSPSEITSSMLPSSPPTKMIMKDEFTTVAEIVSTVKVQAVQVSVPASVQVTSASIVNRQSTKDPLNHHLTIANIAQSTISPTKPTTVRQTSLQSTIKPTVGLKLNTTTVKPNSSVIKQTASFNIILAIILAVIILLVLGFLLYRNRRRFMKPREQQVVMKQRTPNTGPSYARFHDEFNMSGDF